jgi:hypothetical protein
VVAQTSGSLEASSYYRRSSQIEIGTFVIQGKDGRRQEVGGLDAGHPARTALYRLEDIERGDTWLKS